MCAAESPLAIVKSDVSQFWFDFQGVPWSGFHTKTQHIFKNALTNFIEQPVEKLLEEHQVPKLHCGREK